MGIKGSLRGLVPGSPIDYFVEAPPCLPSATPHPPNLKSHMKQALFPVFQCCMLKSAYETLIASNVNGFFHLVEYSNYAKQTVSKLD